MSQLSAKKINQDIKKRSKKPVVLWAVLDKSIDDEKPITFTATRSEAMYALDQYLYVKHYLHFKQWCNLRGLEVDHAETWASYSQQVLADEYNGEPLYSIVRIEYEPNVIASLLRFVNNCIPLGCPFDTDEEVEDYANYLAEKTDRVNAGDDKFTPLEEAITALVDDMTDDSSSFNRCDA